MSDGPMLTNQYLTIRNSMMFVSVSGTGSHLAMFLPDGAVNIEIHYNNTLAPVNYGLCPVMSDLTCLSSDSYCPANIPADEATERNLKARRQSRAKKFVRKIVQSNCKHESVRVNVESFSRAIEVAKKKLSNSCDMALANK